MIILRHAGKSRSGKQLVLAKCMCGAEKVVVLSNIRSGNTTNCGCVRKAGLRIRNEKHGHAHRARRSRAYQAWANMWQRCTNAKSTKFRFYGGRGVKVCVRWREFQLFLADMGECPPGLTLDRIDPSGDYEPGNVRWATWEVQYANKRSK